jgi:L-ascorbate metabolism protein UlaG (beta-lactamase superfamily)
MSLREAFGFAEFLKASSFVPMHWDMFKDNSMFEEEIKICYNNLKLPFKLNMDLINTMYKYL